LIGVLQWFYGFATFLPWSLLEKFITPEFKQFLLNIMIRLKAKQIQDDISK